MLTTKPYCPLLSLALLFFATTLIQGQNLPCSAINLPNDMPDFQMYSTAGTSNSGEPDPGCGGPITTDIWFAVTAPPSGDMDIATLAGTMGNAAMAFYQGPCNNLMLLACTDDDVCGNTIMPVMQFDELIPGFTYYIRIWPEGGGGTFEIRVTDGDPMAPPITLQPTGTAIQTGPTCIQLTNTSTSQAGCAWDPVMIDFSQPFSNTIILNFGTTDANGADGICLVYQNDPAGLNACGTVGGSIGAGNIMNSFIIEFDTWDNGAPADTPADHIAVNVNGLMTAPINGPVPLPFNIEDGQDHEIMFSWNPAGNMYQIFFDGIPYLSGSYDVINNCFGGLTTAYCGYTASTGAATNTHTICTPGPTIYPAGNESEVDAEICEGEFYYAGGAFQTTSGTYFDFFPAANGCDSIIVTNLTVNPASNTTLSEVVCSGDCVDIGPSSFCSSGSYQVTLDNYVGCDSNVFLSLIVLDPFAFIAPPEELNCTNASVSLNGTGSLTGPGVSYQWTGPNPGCIQSDPTGLQINVVCPGTYTLEVSQLVSGVECTATSQVTVVQNIETVDVSIGDPPEINCSNPCITLDASNSTSGPNYEYEWTGPGPFSSDELNPEVCEAGTYQLIITNPDNGCFNGETVEVLGNAEVPIADAGADTLLTCTLDSVLLDGGNSSSGIQFQYEWLDEGGMVVGNTTQQWVDAEGTYLFTVVDTTSGCTATDTIQVYADLAAPVADAGPDQVLDCTIDMVLLDGGGSSSGPQISYQWLDAFNTPLGANTTQSVSDAGDYFLVITNTSNGCTDTSQVTVAQDINAPISDAGANVTLNCTQTDAVLDGSNSSTGPQYQYTWLDAMGNDLGSDPLLPVDMPGTYTLGVLNTDNNCEEFSEVEVSLDTVAPPVITGPDTLINCLVTELVLGDSAAANNPDLVFFWEDENGMQIGAGSTISVDAPGNYTLFVENSANNCTASAEVIVDEDTALPLVDAGANGSLTCAIEQVTLDGSNSDTGMPFSLLWLDENGTQLGTDPEQIVDAAGQYTLLITNTTNGCQDSSTVEVIEDVATPLADAGTNDTITCTNPSILLNGGGSTPASVVFAWLDPGQTPIGASDTITILNPGVYSLIVTDPANGCADTTTVTVEQNISQPAADAGPDQTLDCIAASVALDGSNSSQGANITYTWLNGNNTVVGTDLMIDIEEADMYTLVVTDQTNGCSSSSTVEVAQDADAPIADAGPNDTLTCTVAMVELDGSNSSFGPGISISWEDAGGNPIGQGPMQTISEPGLYTLVVSDQNNGCTSESTVEVAIDTLAPQADAGLPFVLDCDTPDGMLGGPGTSAGPEFSYVWFDDNGDQVGQSATLSVNVPGIYTLEVNNATNECVSTATVTVDEDLVYPQAVAGSDMELNCFSPTTTLDATGSSQGPEFLLEWLDENGQVLSGDVQLPVSQEGTFIISVSNLDNACISTDTVQVSSDFALPSVDAGQDLLLNCYAPSGFLDGSNSSSGINFDYSWTDEPGNYLGSDPTLSVNAAGLYNLEILNTDNGCIESDEVAVTEDFSAPDATAGNDQILNCFNPTLTLSGSGSTIGTGITYNWTDPDNITISTSIFADADVPGEYILLVTDTENGCTSSDTTTVSSDFAVPTADAGVDALIDCINQSVTMDGSGSSSGPGFSYAWYGVNHILLSETLTYETMQAGTYFFEVFNEDNGCAAEDTIHVDIDQEFPDVQLNADGILTCSVLEVGLDASGSSEGPQFEYQWNTISGGVVSPNPDPITATVTEPGVYEFFIGNLDNGCANSITVEVLQDIEPPFAEAGPSQHLNCFLPAIALEGFLSSGNGNLDFEWTTTDGTIDSGINLPSPVVSSAGTYTLLVTDQANGCTDEDEVVVTSSMLEELSVAVDPPLCFGQFGSLHITEVTGGVSPFLYSIDGGDQFSQQSQFLNLEPGEYEVAVQDDDGCTIGLPIVIPAAEEVQLSTDAEVVIQLGETAQLLALTNLGPGEIGSIAWSPATGLDCTDCLDPVAMVDGETLYTVTITDQNGCAAEARVVVKLDKRVDIYAPNIFSPNNDGLNDQFLLFAGELGVKEIRSLQIFSRWGELVFVDGGFPPNDPNHGWDGSYRNQPMDPGVFVWWAEVELIDGRVEILKGDVTLVR